MHAPRSFEAPAPHGIDVTWLLRLRWLLTAGQGALVAWMRLGLGMEIPVLLLAGLLALGAASNGLLALLLGRGLEAGPGLLSAVMLVDTVLLTALLALTGGPFNPFTALYLVHVVLATLVLPRALTWALFCASFAGFAALFWFQGQTPPEGLRLPSHQELMRLHLAGMLVAFALSTLVVVYFIGRVQAALRQRDAELEKARQAAHRNERLATLTTLSAGAAHELATPLGTIAVAAKELERALSRSEAGAPFREDAVLIRSQVQRCREILDRMSVTSGELKGEAPTRFGVEAWLAEAKAGLAHPERIEADATECFGAQLEGPRTALAQALRNVLQNALDASDGPVGLKARRELARLVLEVTDGGAGIRPEVLGRIGEPFFTTKPPGQGMGLGVFLTRSVVEHLGGGFSLESPPGRGAVARLWLPLGAQEERR